MSFDYIINIWPIVVFFLTAIFTVSHFIAKLYLKVVALKQYVDTEKELFTAKLESIRAELKAELKLLEQRVATLEMVTAHLTRMGEDIKSEIGGINVTIMKLTTVVDQVYVYVKQLNDK